MNKLVLPLILVIFLSGCVQQNGERIFVETGIVPQTHQWCNTGIQPIQYGLIKNKVFGIEFTATKYMSNTDGLMSIHINLPEAVRLLKGNTQWRGNVVSKTVYLELVAAKMGKYEIEMIATNTANGFTTSQKIDVCIGEDLEEIILYCTGEIPAPPLPG